MPSSRSSRTPDIEARRQPRELIKVYATPDIKDSLAELAARRGESVSQTALAAIKRFLIVAAGAEIERQLHNDPDFTGPTAGKASRRRRPRSTP